MSCLPDAAVAAGAPLAHHLTDHLNYSPPQSFDICPPPPALLSPAHAPCRRRALIGGAVGVSVLMLLGVAGYMAVRKFIQGRMEAAQFAATPVSRCACSCVYMCF